MRNPNSFVKWALPGLAVALMGSSQTCTFQLEGSGELTPGIGCCAVGCSCDAGCDATDGGPAGPADAGDDEVVYDGERFGRIFITASLTDAETVGSPNFYSTSVNSPGPYTIHLDNNAAGLTTGNHVYLMAWMDVLNMGHFVAGADPAGQTVATLQSDGTLTAPSVTLVDPPPPFDADAFWLHPAAIIDGAFPFDSGAMVWFKPIVNDQGFETVDHYLVTAHCESSCAGGETDRRLHIRAGGYPFALFSTLTPGATYHFTMAGENTGVTYMASSPFPSGPGLVASDPTGGNEINGDFDFSNVTFSSGSCGNQHVYIFAMDDSLGHVALQRVDVCSAMSGVGSYAIQGLPDGTYGVAALVDRNGDGEIDPTDVATFENNQELEAPVSVNSMTTPQTAASFASRSPADVRVVAATSHFAHDLGMSTIEEGWSTAVQIESDQGMAVRGKLTSSVNPTWGGVQDMIFERAGKIEWSIVLNNDVEPTTSDEYGVSYSQDTTTLASTTGSNALPLTGWPTDTNHNVTKAIDHVIEGFAQSISISCTMGGVPEFAWSDPSDVPVDGYTWEITVTEPPPMAPPPGVFFRSEPLWSSGEFFGTGTMGMPSSYTVDFGQNAGSGGDNGFREAHMGLADSTDYVLNIVLRDFHQDTSTYYTTFQITSGCNGIAP